MPAAEGRAAARREGYRQHGREDQSKAAGRESCEEGGRFQARRQQGLFQARRRKGLFKPDAKKATSKPVKKTIAKLPGYPGTSKQPPLHLEKCTVFSQPPQWRVQKVGEKGDKAFSFKVQEPRQVWKRVKAYVESL